MTMKRLKLLLLALLSTLTMMAQERTITGVVMDGELEGEPLIGATVSVGDGKVGQGTITDYEGRFTLKVPAGTKKLTVSGGFQITRYGNTDEYINDLTFVVNSWSYGLGVKYQVTDKIAVNAAYFKTCYDDYKTQLSAEGVQNSFTRSNRVGAIGIDINF